MAVSDEWSEILLNQEISAPDKNAFTKSRVQADLTPFRSKIFSKPPTDKNTDQGELKRGRVVGHGESRGQTESEVKEQKGKADPGAGEPKWKLDSGHTEPNYDNDSMETWHSYVVLAVSFFSCFLTDGLQSSYGVIYQDLKSYYSADVSRLALPLATLDFMTHFGALFTSAFVKVFGLRAAGFIGGLVSAGGFVIAYLAPSLEVFTVAYGLIVGTGFAFMYLSAIVAVQTYFDKRRSLAAGVNNAGSALGVFAMSPLVRFLLNKYTWRGSMLIKAGIVLQCTWLWLLVRPLPDNEQNKSHKNKEQNSHKQELKSSFRYNKVGLSSKMLTMLKETFDFKLFKEYRFSVYSSAIFIAQMGFPITYVFAPDKGTEMGFSHDDTKWFVSFTGVGGLIGRLTFGFIGNFPILQDKRLHLQRLSVGLTGVSLVLVPACRTLTSMYIILTMYGFAVGGHIVVIPVTLYDLFGSDVLTRSFGLSLVMIGLASMVTTPLSGFIRDRTNAYDPVFFLAGGYFVIAMCIMLVIPVSKQEDKTKRQYLELP